MPRGTKGAPRTRPIASGGRPAETERSGEYSDESERLEGETARNIAFDLASSHFGALFILQLVDVCEFIEYWRLLFGAPARLGFHQWRAELGVVWSLSMMKNMSIFYN